MTNEKQVIVMSNSITALTEALYRMVHESRLSAEEIVERAFGVNDDGNPKKSKWTLYRELNPDDAGAKLGALDVLRIMLVTGDVRPLEVMAEAVNCIVRPKNAAEPDRPTWAEEHAQDSGRMGQMASLMERGAHPAEVERQAALLKDEIDQTATRYRRQYEQGEVRHD